MAREARAGHAVRMADGDRPARDIVFLGVDAELVTAIEHLRGKGLVQLPDIDLVNRQAVLAEKFGNGEDRADPHLFGIAAGHGDAAKASQRLEPAARCLRRLHDHHGRRPVRQLRGVACRNEGAFGKLLAVAEDRLQPGQPLGRRRRAHALVGFQRDRPVADLARFLVLDLHHGRQRHDLGIEPAFGLGSRGPAMRLCRIFILCLARHTISRGHDFGRLDHRHIHIRPMLVDPRIDKPVRVHPFGLHKRDRFNAATDTRIHLAEADAVIDNGKRHKPGRTLPVHSHARDRGRQPGPDQPLARDIHMCRALLQRGTHDHIADLPGSDAGARNRLADGVACQLLGLSVVESAAIGLADRRTGCGNDDGVTHETASPHWKTQQSASQNLWPAASRYRLVIHTAIRLCANYS